MLDCVERGPQGRSGRAAALRMAFVGAAAARAVGEGRQPGQHHYLRGARERWRVGVPRYDAVRLADLYPGVDVRLREADGHPEYDLLLGPGADLSRVVVQVDGAEGLALQADGSMRVDTSIGPMRQPRPRTWQVLASGARQPVDCRFVLLGPDRFGFEVAGWDRDLALTIDPGLLWSTAIPGNQGGSSRPSSTVDVAVDSSGIVTVAGHTEDSAFPVSTGAYATSIVGLVDVLVFRLDPRQLGASQLEFATFLGGSDGERPTKVHVDDGGIVTVVGATGSGDFPTTANAYDRTFNGSGDVFVSRFDPSLQGAAQLVYSTFVGGPLGDVARALFVGDDGVITTSGVTFSGAYPVTGNALQSQFSGGTAQFPYDAFLTMLDPGRVGAAQLVYSTYLGGTAWETPTDVFVDDAGHATIVGETASDDLAMTSDAYDATFNGGVDAFLIQVDPAGLHGQQLVYSTFLGGSASDWLDAIVIDAAGVMTLAGDTTSSDFPDDSRRLRRDDWYDPL